jgi:hypothetical protein
MADDMEANMVTRRRVLSAGVASALVWLVSTKGIAGVVPSPQAREAAYGIGRDPRSAELYVFPSTQTARTAIALTWPKRVHGAGSRFRIHAGSHSWAVEIPARNSEWQQDEVSLFCGTVVSGTLDALVMEFPSRMITTTGPVGIWAERFTRSGIRQRIGSPFLAKILTENDAMADTYHSISPSDDRQVLTEAVARAIAAKVRMKDAEAYGRRLASVLLPDVLRYDPAHALGFTFAARNGRHPLDASEVVVDSILSGCPAPAPPVAERQLNPHFPYFVPYLNAI